MNNNKHFLPLKIILGVVLSIALLFLCTVGILTAKGYGASVGRILKADENTYMLIVDQTPIKMSDRSKGKTLFEGYHTGDKVLVIHGGIEDSYPAQSGAYAVIRLKAGEETDIPHTVISELTQLGWIKNEKNQ